MRRRHTIGLMILAAALVFTQVNDAQAQAKVKVADEVAKLKGSNVSAAKAAALRLSSRTAWGAVGGLVDALSVGLRPEIAVAALNAVAKHKRKRSLEVVALYSRHRSVKVRLAALGAAATVNDPRATAIVLKSLRDSDKGIRALAASIVEKRKLRQGIESLLELLKKGDQGVVIPLANMANANLARAVSELTGVAPDMLVARILGLLLRRPKFGPETARVQVIRALGKVPGTETIEQLSAYIESIPEKPIRKSRLEAEAYREALLTGGN